MENNPFDHRELHDFLNVESFSQLPFIRTAKSHKEKGFRLFGKEFGGGETPAAVTITGLDESYATAVVASEDAKEICNDNNNGEENTRKFECQYCCRNFPTSQALGGHQNAHKRERQHAKRAQLQSSMMHAGGLAEVALLPAHMYGPMNYHRLGGGFASAPSLAYHHDNWNKNSSAYTSSSRLYGSLGGGGGSTYSQPPINGSSLALWQIPSAHSSRIFNRSEGGSMHQRPLLGNPEFNNPQVIKSAVSQLPLGYDQSKPKMIDPVSLDLHL